TDDGRTLEADLTGDEIGEDRLVDLRLEIHDAARAEAVDRISRLRIEGDETIARCDVQDPFITAIGPIRQAAAGELSRRGRASRPLVFSMHPALLAGCGIERDDGAIRSTGRIQNTVYDERRALELELRPRTERIGLEPPRDFQ